MVVHHGGVLLHKLLITNLLVHGTIHFTEPQRRPEERLRVPPAVPRYAACAENLREAGAIRVPVVHTMRLALGDIAAEELTIEVDGLQRLPCGGCICCRGRGRQGEIGVLGRPIIGDLALDDNIGCNGSTARSEKQGKEGAASSP